MANCPHGFPEGQCLICQTLGTAPRSTKTAEQHQGLMLAERHGRLPAGGGAKELADRPRRGRFSLLGALALVVVAGLLVWAFAGLFVLAFHIFEFAALALVAGWLGYKLGHARGRRQHHPT